MAASGRPNTDAATKRWSAAGYVAVSRSDSTTLIVLEERWRAPGGRADMQAYWEGPARAEGMALLQPFFANQYTVTHCEVQTYTRDA